MLNRQNIKVKYLVGIENNRGYRAFLKYKDLDLIQLNFLKRDIGDIFDCTDINFRMLDEDLVLSIYKPKEYLEYKPVELSNHELLLGYSQEGYIIADMSKYPHLLISGLSNQGKSRMVAYMLRNLNQKADILVLNGFKKDYRGFTLVSGLKSIERRIEAILESKIERDKPLYIILEEMQILSKHKKLQDNLKELLSVGRHYNIYVIGIIQNATKENCNFKDLFNCRCTFRQIDTSSYKVCMGVDIAEVLEQREFYYLDKELVKGYTFTT